MFLQCTRRASTVRGVPGVPARGQRPPAAPGPSGLQLPAPSAAACTQSAAREHTASSWGIGGGSARGRGKEGGGRSPLQPRRESFDGRVRAQCSYGCAALSEHISQHALQVLGVHVGRHAACRARRSRARSSRARSSRAPHAAAEHAAAQHSAAEHTAAEHSRRPEHARPEHAAAEHSLRPEREA